MFCYVFFPGFEIRLHVYVLLEISAHFATLICKRIQLFTSTSCCQVSYISFVWSPIIFPFSNSPILLFLYFTYFNCPLFLTWEKKGIVFRKVGPFGLVDIFLFTLWMLICIISIIVFSSPIGVNTQTCPILRQGLSHKNCWL